jgi:uncharacterized protein (TIGR03437 family)
LSWSVVQDLSPRVLPVGPTGPDPPSGSISAYATEPSSAIHEDWSAPVDRDNPARPGEIIHFYASGWGDIDGSVTSGLPTPGDRLYRITAPCEWRATGADRDVASFGRSFEVLFAGLSPGFVGIYQLDLRIPGDWAFPIFEAFCVLRSATNTFYLETGSVEVKP